MTADTMPDEGIVNLRADWAEGRQFLRDEVRR